ncbi:MAG TPA: TadE/TadG family type IV pilus assembly protein [bacterium]|nr:TadE/TadG family type IV pilus assembly protein [bacterium]
MAAFRKWTPTGGEGGAVAVEFVIIFPLLFLFICGIIEFGRIMAIKNLATSAAREGARTAILAGATGTDVYDKITSVLDGGGLTPFIYGLSITVNESGVTNTYPLGPGLSLANVDGGSPVTVSVQIDFGACALIPGFLDWIILDGTVTMRREKMV